VVLVDFSPARPAEVDYIRPAVVVTNNQAQRLCSRGDGRAADEQRHENLSHAALFTAERSGLDRDSKAQVELLRHLTVERIQKTLSHLPDDLMAQLGARLREHLAL
jgi:mRNA interferase MazF